ncbi:MAG: hypothetical protein ACOX5E_00775 [Bacilli bacterium]
MCSHCRLKAHKVSTITWTVKSGTAVVIVDNVVTEVIRPGS